MNDTVSCFFFVNIVLTVIEIGEFFNFVSRLTNTCDALCYVTTALREVVPVLRGGVSGI